VPIEINPLCPKCNSGSDLVVGPFGPHYGKFMCARCGRFISWAKTPHELRPDIMGGTVYSCPECAEREFSIKLSSNGRGGDIVCGTCGFYVSFLPVQKLEKLNAIN
jgi:ssDNA-binding Zn-finger/Zn-ribbon topoisomerase 1